MKHKKHKFDLTLLLRGDLTPGFPGEGCKRARPLGLQVKVARLQ